MESNKKLRTIDHLLPKITKWAEERKLLDTSSELQLAKVTEELGELSGNVIRGNNEELKDCIGDLLVAVHVFCVISGLDMKECLNIAFKEIENRKGITINGSFIKCNDSRISKMIDDNKNKSDENFKRQFLGDDHDRS